MYVPELSALFVFTYARASWRVFFNRPTGVHGRCHYNQRFVTVSENTTLDTLAHEAAHVLFHSHGPKHKVLTATIHEWMLENWTQYV